MNVHVAENAVIDCEFAEGNEFAISHFCSESTSSAYQRIIDAKLTVHDIFDVIQASITNDEGIAVTYHEDIGIPLAIAMDPSSGSIDEKSFIAIHCFLFDANDDVAMQDFNDNDPYSCHRIQGIFAFKFCLNINLTMCTRKHLVS